ncbi:hypothetical protein M9Y10_035373 [Tritrichomonas musculus]|uniref:Uncharacterized protein n=1 Tax=Tritrichomonas musculus TaxID=1915356 RepID=A0ABR2KHI4_9EUKA
MKREQQVYQTDTDEDPFEISSTSTDAISIDTVLNDKIQLDACEIISIIFGILLIIISIIDAFVMFYFPYKKIQDNKRNFMGANFEKLPLLNIIIHFILHGLVCLLGLAMIFIICKRKYDIGGCFIFILCFFIFFLYFYAGTGCPTRDFKPNLNIDDLFNLINNNPPLNFIKVNYQNSFKTSINTNNCYLNKDYQFVRKDVIVPIVTTLTSKKYNYNDFPDIFYTKVIQEIKLSNQLTSYFKNSLNISYDIDPLSSPTFLVSKQKKLSYLSHTTKMLSYFFGVGIYYELYTKAIPEMVSKISLYAEVVPNFNYSSIL